MQKIALRLIGMQIGLIALLLALAHSATATVAAPAPPALNALYSFSALDASYNNPDGANPVAKIALGTDGFLYGTTADGGTAGAGTLFKVKPNGTSFATLYSFAGGADGGYPLAGLTLGADGFLYGTTSDGSTGAAGTLFKIKTDGTGFVTLHAFQADSDGAYPAAGLTLGADGFFYGTTSGGTTGTGTVFKIKADGTGFLTLHTFAAGDEPLGSVVSGVDGFWYGTTMAGGTNAAGTIFKVSSDGSSFSTLYSFAGDTMSGGYPAAALTLGKDGFFYGTTSDNQIPGANGTIFKINMDGTGFTTLYRFTGGNDGAVPLAPLVQGADGFWYGTAFSGGSADGDGTLFKLQSDGSGFTVLATLTGTGAEGSGPSAALVAGPNGTWYGTSSSGGQNAGVEDYGTGAVFALTFPGTTPPPNPATRFVVSAPSTVGAGQSFSVTVTAVDSGGQTVTGYSGNLVFSSDNPNVVLPTQAALTNGVGTFPVTLQTAQTSTVTVKDNAALTGQSGAIMVTPGPASKLSFLSPPTDTARGQALIPAPAVRVTDDWGNPVAASVTLSLSSGTGALGGVKTQTAGGGTATFAGLSVDLAGSKTLTATAGTGTVVSPAFTITDATAPTTTASQNPAAPNGPQGTYTTQVVVTLAATDADDAAGTLTTFYTLDGGSRQPYSGLITLGTEGTHTLSYWSVDPAGTTETAQTRTFSIQFPPAPVPPAPAAGLQINSAGGDYADTTGHTWKADNSFTGGDVYTFTNPNVSGTSDPALYRSVRYGAGFSYKLPAAAGNYTLRLHFMEGDRTAAGQRVFSVSVNGAPVLTNFDIFRDAGGQGIADIKSFPVTSDGSGITVDFRSITTAATAMVSALELVSAGPPTIPAAPSGLSAVAGDGRITLSWNASAGASSYNLYRSTSAGGEGTTPIKTGLTGTGYTDTGLTNGTAYFYTLTAVNSAGTSAPSGEASATPAAAPAATLQINSAGGDYVDTTGHTWKADNSFTGGDVYTFTNPTVSGTSDPALYRSVRYGAGFSYKLPAAAGNYTLRLHFMEGDRTAAGQRVFNVSVNGSAVLTNFDIFRDAGGQGIADIKSFPVTSDGSGITVDFRSITTAATAMVSALELVSAGPPTIPAAPAGLTATPGGKQVMLAWNASAGATSYNLYRSTSAGGEGTTPIKTGLTGTGYTDTGLTNGTAYFYTLTAVNSAGTSAPSGEASATPAAAPAATLQINSAGGDYVDTTGHTWKADNSFTGGDVYTFTNPTVSGTSDPALYRSVRYGAGFSYKLPAAAGNYTLRLHFMEGDRTAAGQRVFNVSVNGSAVLTNFDIFRDAGGQGIADIKSFPVTSDGSGITVDFRALTTAATAMVSAIEVISN